MEDLNGRMERQLIEAVRCFAGQRRRWLSMQTCGFGRRKEDAGLVIFEAAHWYSGVVVLRDLGLRVDYEHL